ncbi:hypothetical protein JCM8097_009123 [Rhodosporidiobolus ruineniae]
MSSFVPLGQPASLDAALVRIAFLEKQLQLAHDAVRDYTAGQEDLTALVERWQRSGSARLPSIVASSSSSSSSTAPLQAASSASSALAPAPPPSAPSPAPTAATLEPAAPSEEEEPLDLGPLVLRAIQLRKDLHIGRVDKADGEGELRRILEAGGERLTEEQGETVRRWAGLD